MVDIVSLIAKAFSLGLSTGAFCTGTCLPLLLPVLFSVENATIKVNSFALLRFFAGRFFAYLLIGLLSGVAGLYLNEIESFQNIVIPAVYIIIGALMIVFGVSGIFKSYKTCRKYKHRNYLFLMGFLMGINICPPFVMAFSVSTELGGILKSLLFFFVFFLTTSLFFIPLIFSKFASKFIIVQKVARYISIAVGIYFVSIAVWLILQLTGVVTVGVY